MGIIQPLICSRPPAQSKPPLGRFDLGCWTGSRSWTLMISDVPAIKTQCHVISESEVTCIYNIVIYNIVIYIYIQSIYNYIHIILITVRINTSHYQCISALYWCLWHFLQLRLRSMKCRSHGQQLGWREVGSEVWGSNREYWGPGSLALDAAGLGGAGQILGIRKPWKNLWEIDGTGGFGWFIGCWSHTWARSRCGYEDNLCYGWTLLKATDKLDLSNSCLRLLGLGLSYEVSWGSW